MRNKIKKIQSRIDQDPKLKKAVTSIKPEKSVWGILGVFAFFFLPELITYIWQEPLVSWAHQHSITEPLESLRLLYGQLEEMFAGGVSWVNIGIGILLLIWLWRSEK